MARIASTYLSVAETIFTELKRLESFKLKVKAANEFTADDEQLIESLLRATKHRINSTIRRKKNLHRDLYIIDSKIPGSVWEHITPIDVAWNFAKTLDLNSQNDLIKFADILRDYIFVRVLVDHDDNKLINKSYKNAKNEMPAGWKFGDCRFERYKCLSDDKLNKLQLQLALL